MRADAVPESRLAPRFLIKAFGVEAERRGDDLPTGRADRWLIRGNSGYKDSEQLSDIVEGQMNARFRAGFQERPAWADGRYRTVWTSDELRCIVTYCEGDVTIELADTEDGYQVLIDYASSFYEGRR